MLNFTRVISFNYIFNIDTGCNVNILVQLLWYKVSVDAWDSVIH